MKKILAVLLAVSGVSIAQAATLTWDADGVSGGSTGGTGTWNTSSALWDNAGTMTTWNNATPDSAIFGGTAGTVTLSTAITAGSLTFNTAGYTIDTGSNALTASTLAGSGNFTKLGTGTLSLSGSSGYTGALTIRDGIVQLSNGASLSSGGGITIEGGAGTVGGTGYPFKGVTRGGTLYLRDDSGSPGSNQLGSQMVTMKNGTILWYSGSGADTTTISNITLASGFNTIGGAPSGNPDVLKITDLTRTAGATVEFRSAYHLLGTGELQIRVTNVNGSAISNTNGILGGWAFVAAATGAAEYGSPARSFAKWDPAATIGTEVGSIVAATPDKANGTSGATTNSQDIASAASTENWLINDSSTRNVIGASGTTTVTVNSLIEEADLKINNGSTLVVNSGGVIFRNNNFWLQTGAGSTGYITSGTNDLYLQTDGGTGDQFIKVIIKDGAGAVTLRKSGSGLVKLNQINTYTGGTFINQGTLDLQTGGSSGCIRGTATVNAGGVLQLNAGDATGYGGGASALTTINLNGGNLNVNTTANQTLGSAVINMTGGSITGNTGGNLDFYGGSSALNSKASATTSTISGVPLSPLRQGNTTFDVEDGAAAVDLQIDSVIRTSPSGDGGTSTLTKSGAGWLQLRGVNTFIRPIAITGGTVEIAGSGSLSGNATQTINISSGAAFNFNSSASQTIAGKISGAGVVKVTSGTLTLSNAGNDYTGATTVNGGVLNVTGSTAAGSAFSVAGSATLKGTGTVGGNVTVASGGIITGGDGTTGTLAIGGNLTYNGNGTVNIGTLSNYSSSAAVSITGTLNPNGNTITLNLPTGVATGGTYHLLGTSYNSLTGIALGTTPALSTRQSGSLAATASYIDYVISGVNPYWTGAQSSEWSTATIAGSKNWALPANGTTDYIAGDVVLFDDTATGTTVDITTADVSPTSVTFDNTSKTYTVTGSKGIIGTTGLTKSGTGTLTLGSVNNYSGATAINAGTVKLGSATALGATSGSTTVGSGAVLDLNGQSVGAEALTISGTGILSGGALVNSSGTAASLSGLLTLGGASSIKATSGDITLSNTGTITGSGYGLTVGGAYNTTIAGIIGTGAGALTKQDAGTLTLTGNNTYTGGTTVNGGTLAVTGPTSATGTITVGGGTLTLAGNWNNAGNVTINSGGTLTLSSGGLYRNTDGSDIYTTGYAVTVKTGGVLNVKGWGYGLDGGFGGASDYSAQRVIDGGTVNITGNSNTGTYSALFRVTANGGSFNMLTAGQTTTIASNGNDNIRVGGTLTFGGAGNITVNDTIENNTSSGSVIYAGSGTLTLGAANTFSGSLSANSGTVVVSNTLRSVSGVTATNSGSIIQLNAINMFVAGHGVAVPNTMVLTANGGTLLMDTGMESRIGNITLTNGGTFTSNRAMTSYDLLLADTTSGAATVTVSGTGAATMNGSGGIHLQGVQNFNVADVTGDANTDLTVGLILGSQGTSGGAAGGINKTGAGTMLLTAANTYTGATSVSQGTLDVTGSLSSTSVSVANTATLINNGTIAGAVTVDAGGTLSGSGTVNGLTTINGTHKPGNSPGLDTYGAGLTYNAGSVLEWEFSGDALTTRGTDYDGINVTGGTVTLTNAATFKIINYVGTVVDYTAAAWDVNRTFNVISLTGGATLTGTLFTLDDITNAPLDQGSWSLVANAGGLDVKWTAIPEPATFSLLGAAAFAAIWRRRKIG